MSELKTLLNQASSNRFEVLERLHAENTHCYRLFHGTNEGRSGLTVDRYGEQLLVQTFHNSLTEGELATINDHFQSQFKLSETIYNDRSADNSRRADEQFRSSQQLSAQEIGVSYRVKGKHSGQDPLLFLDMRVGRRFILGNSAGKSVLNLFSYTCGVGICAAVAGANEVWNVDFAERNLAVGADNAELNSLNETDIQFIQSDFFTAAKQLAGLPVKQRVRRGQKPRQFKRLEEKHFDLVYLDPPRWAKSHFGTVDLIRDYPSVLKPSLLSTKEGGTLVCTNNVAKVSLDEWLDVLQRCAKKVGRTIRDIEILTPESDFPSPDGQHPLKIAVLQV